jgi:hypothetical protein
MKDHEMILTDSIEGGVWLACECGKRVRLGYGSTPNDAMISLSRHHESVGPRAEVDRLKRIWHDHLDSQADGAEAAFIAYSAAARALRGMPT